MQKPFSEKNCWIIFIFDKYSTESNIYWFDKQRISILFKNKQKNKPVSVVRFHLRLSACPSGTFGFGCVNHCNNTCRGCNTVNGLCDAGCYPGWRGVYCHQSNQYKPFQYVIHVLLSVNIRWTIIFRNTCKFIFQLSLVIFTLFHLSVLLSKILAQITTT